MKNVSTRLFSLITVALLVVTAAACGDDSAKKKDGETCAKNDECQSNVCGANKKCAAKAVAKLAIGKTCSKDEECESGHCHDKKCAKAEGSTDKVALGGACSTAKPCGDKLKCVSDKCVGEVGFDKCKKDDDCDGTATCKKAAGAAADATGTCTAAGSATKKKSGEACAAATDCESALCEDVSGAKKCVGKKEDACDDTKICGKDFYCASSKCADKKAKDEACTKAEECKSGKCESSKCADA